MTTIDDSGRSTLQRIHKLCESYDLSGPADVWPVQVVMEDALAAFASAVGDEVSLGHLSKSYAVEKAEVERWLTASVERLANAQRCIREF